MHDTIFKKPKLIVFGNHYIGICEYKKKKKEGYSAELNIGYFNKGDRLGTGVY